MPLYSMRSPDIVTKFDNSGNVEASYSTSSDACTCPAGQRPTCRHRQMLRYLRPIIDSHWFLDWDNGRRIVDFQGNTKTLLDALTASAPPATLHAAPEGRFQPEASSVPEAAPTIPAQPTKPHPFRRL